jgi:biotin carboxyl carrier protein
LNPESSNPPHAASTAVPSKPRNMGLRLRTRVLFFLVAWAIVLLPFLFWRSTWFGRQLPDTQMAEYLRDEQKPRHIQHALVQLGERIARHDASVQRFYPEVVRLKDHRLEEIRNTAAWIMGQDTTRPEFHQALRAMLRDSSPTVRANAALALIRFGDETGHAELLRMLAPENIIAPASGRVLDLAPPGTAIREGGLLLKLATASEVVELRSPINGRVRSVSVQKDAQVAAGTEVAVVDPAAEQVWEALRGLYLIGKRDDLPAVRAYLRPMPDIPDRVRQQASLTESAILRRTTETQPQGTPR